MTYIRFKKLPFLIEGIKSKDIRVWHYRNIKFSDANYIDWILQNNYVCKAPLSRKKFKIIHGQYKQSSKSLSLLIKFI